MLNISNQTKQKEMFNPFSKIVYHSGFNLIYVSCRLKPTFLVFLIWQTIPPIQKILALPNKTGLRIYGKKLVIILFRGTRT